MPQDETQAAARMSSMSAQVAGPQDLARGSNVRASMNTQPGSQPGSQRPSNAGSVRGSAVPSGVHTPTQRQSNLMTTPAVNNTILGVNNLDSNRGSGANMVGDIAGGLR